MRLRTGSRTARSRLRVVALTAGVSLLALTAAEAPVLGSDAVEQATSTAGVASRSAIDGPGHADPKARAQGSNAWHTARAGAGPTSARAAEWRSAISPSPYLSRAQIDAMSPAQIVHATLGDVVPRHTGHAARAAQKPTTRHHRLHFGLTTFNALGSQHTAPGGDAVAYAPGRIRTQWMADYLTSINSSIVGMQEIQADQVDNLNLTTGGRFSFWPAAALGGAGIPQTMMWSTADWKPKKLDYIVVPFMGGTRPQPVVELKNRKTRGKIFVINIHNSPKDAKGRQGERNRAIAIEQKAVRSLRASGLPVFIVGDFNDHEKAFCGMTDRTSLKAANGGSHARKGACRPPKNMRVDWIFGSRQVQFKNYLADQGPIVGRITDHAAVTTKVTVH